MESQGNVNRFEWTEARIQRLRTLAALGLSGGKIANDIGCTRNAVMGKMHRNGIKSTNATGHQVGVPAPWKSIPKSPRPNAQTVRAKPKWHEPKLRALEEPVQPPSEPPPTAKAFEELAPGECRWAYGDATPYLFCGDAQAKDKPYCAGHCVIAYRVTPRQERAKFWVAA